MFRKLLIRDRANEYTTRVETWQSKYTAVLKILKFTTEYGRQQFLFACIKEEEEEEEEEEEAQEEAEEEEAEEEESVRRKMYLSACS
jgi:hypothetical protein